MDKNKIDQVKNYNAVKYLNSYLNGLTTCQNE